MLPDLPLELWHRILGCTCTYTADSEDDDDQQLNCTTPLVLSRTSRELRHISRYHRYHSVTIRGWEQLLAFEERFGSIIERRKEEGDDGDGPTGQQDRSGDDEGPHSGIVHLNVEIEWLWSVVHPNWNDEYGSDTSEDSSYASSSESEEDEPVEGTQGDEGARADAGGDAEEDIAEENLMEEHAFEFSELSDLEAIELAEDITALAEERRVLTLLYRGMDMQTLSILQVGKPTPIARLEFRVYSALRRLLEACAPTLEVLSLSWKPTSTFFVEAVFPVLPKLRVLRWEKSETDSSRMYPIWPRRERQAPVVFPALQQLDVVASGDISALKDVLVLCPGVRTVSLPHYLIRRQNLLIQNKKVRVHVGASWQRRMGRLTDEEARSLELRITDNNEYYAVS